MNGSQTGFAAFRHREFLALAVARACSLMAMQMQVVAIGWEVYDRGGSAFDLGLIGLVQFAPVLPLFLIAGQVIDRVDRRAVLLCCYLVHLTAALTLLGAMLLGRFDLGLVLLVLLAIGAARVFEHPANASLLPNVVPEAALKSAVSWNSALSQSAMVAGPALGGFAYLAGRWTVFALAAVFVVAAIAGMTRIARRAAPNARQPPGRDALLHGLRFMNQRREILGAISLDLFAVLVGSATALLPIFARDVLMVGPWGLGLMRSANAVGAIATGAFLAFRPIERRAGPTMLAAVAAYGAMLIVLGLSTSFALSLLALFLIGASDQVSVNVRQTLIQFRTPDELRGRVNSVNAMFINTSNQLGQFEAGATAALLGVVSATVVGGVAVIGVVAVCATTCVALRRVDAMEPARGPR